VEIRVADSQRGPARNFNLVFQYRAVVGRLVAGPRRDERILLKQRRQTVDFADTIGLDDPRDGNSASGNGVLIVEREP